MRSNRKPDSEWLDVIQECRTSGLSDTAWCHKNNIPPSTFYSVIKRLRRKACAIPEAHAEIRSDVQEVVPISFNEPVTTYQSPIALESSVDNSAIQIVVNDYKIQISNSCAKETIKNTLLALREIC